jgi:hypothetical protein
MKKLLLLLSALLLQTVFVFAQSAKEEEFAKAFFEIIKKGDKKELTEKLLLKESDFELYNQSQTKLGNPKVLTKDEYVKMMTDKNGRILRDFDEMRAHTIKTKIVFDRSVYTSFKLVAPPNADLPTGYYKLFFTFENTFTIKLLYEACPLGEELKLYNVQNTINVVSN